MFNSNKKKITLSLILLAVSAGILVSYAVSPSGPELKSIPNERRNEAIAFTENLLVTARKKDARGFIARGEDAKNRLAVLRDCFIALGQITPAENPDWDILNPAEEPDTYYVYFNNDQGARAVVVLKYSDGQWQFSYVPCG